MNLCKNSFRLVLVFNVMINYGGIRVPLKEGYYVYA